MKNPPHPGEIIRDLYLKPLGLTVTEAAAGLGATRETFSLLVNGHASISPDMAARLSKAFGRTPEVWLQFQSHSMLRASISAFRRMRSCSLSPRDSAVDRQ